MATTAAVDKNAQPFSFIVFQLSKWKQSDVFVANESYFIVHKWSALSLYIFLRFVAVRCVNENEILRVRALAPLQNYKVEWENE